ncbi:Late embryogenesis abundant protein [Parasponia andersonii]|uniref:Late embryogenesis abundant protein n=1 Tax=Parasponia andersonii TaxID=3476 RepID=A0A2P5C7L0_PARAD|nr:Late embryogenesis abundant protein [Parasponia andersonii]
MQSAKEKLSNMASSAKEHIEVYKAKGEEKVEKAAARTEEEKKIAEERRKAREAEAKRELHEAKAKHATEKLSRKQRHLHHHPDPPLVGDTTATATDLHHGHHHQPVGTANLMAGATKPTYPLGNQFPGNKHL